MSRQKNNVLAHSLLIHISGITKSFDVIIGWNFIEVPTYMSSEFLKNSEFDNPANVSHKIYHYNGEVSSGDFRIIHNVSKKIIKFQLKAR